jgi:hypothetical protein
MESGVATPAASSETETIAGLRERERESSGEPQGKKNVAANPAPFRWKQEAYQACRGRCPTPILQKKILSKRLTALVQAPPPQS